MEEMTVVFFYVDKEKWGKVKPRKKRRKVWKYGKARRKTPAETWLYDVRRGTAAGEQEGVVLHWAKVYLPAYESEGEEWTGEGLAEYLRGLHIPPESRWVYYLPDRAAGKLLGRTAEPLPLEWVLCLINYYALRFDGLVVLQDREMDAEELVFRFAKGTRYIGVVTGDRNTWEEAAETLSEEYGFWPEVAERFQDLHLTGSRILFIGGKKLYQATPSMLPPECVWLDTDVQGETGKSLCINGNNVKYIEIRGFLQEMFRKRLYNRE